MKHPRLGWIELGGAGIFRPEVTQPLGQRVLDGARKGHVPEAVDEGRHRGDQHQRGLAARHVGPQQQRCQHQLLDRVGVGSRGVKHRHTLLGHSSHWDIVDTRPRPSDGLDCLRYLHFMHLVRAHQNSIRVGYL